MTIMRAKPMTFFNSNSLEYRDQVFGAIRAPFDPGISPVEGQRSPLQMCDYSLHSVASRPARVGDKLLTTKFSNSITRGFAAVGEPNVAVCLLPGTEIAFDKEAECGHVFSRIMPSLRFGKTGQKVARFRQVDLDQRHTHHDALEFPDGRIVRVTNLCEGQTVTVLQLPVSEGEATVTEKQRTESLVV